MDDRSTGPTVASGFDWIDNAAILETRSGRDYLTPAKKLCRLARYVEQIGRADRYRFKVAELYASSNRDDCEAGQLLQYALDDRSETLAAHIRCLGHGIEGTRYSVLNAVSWIVDDRPDPLQSRQIQQLIDKSGPRL
jgi:hypothetical protein